jgi:hypothetical protein
VFEACSEFSPDSAQVAGIQLMGRWAISANSWRRRRVIRSRTKSQERSAARRIYSLSKLHQIQKRRGCSPASVSTDRHQCRAVGNHYGRSLEHNQMPVLELA